MPSSVRKRRTKGGSATTSAGAPIGLLGAPAQLAGAQCRSELLHMSLYRPPAASAIDAAMVDAAGRLLGLLDEATLPLVFLHVLAIPDEARSGHRHDYKNAVWKATSGAVALALSCKMLYDILKSAGHAEFRELTAMTTTTSVPRPRFWAGAHPFILQLKDEHSSSRAAMVMGEALKTMATHCASVHCLMSRRGVNNCTSSQGRVRVAYDAGRRTCTAGNNELIVATDSKTKARRGAPEQQHSVLLVACRPKGGGSRVATEWQSKSDMETRQLTNLADQSSMPDNIRIVEPEKITVASLAASDDGRHVLIEFGSQYAIKHTSTCTELQTTTFSYIWLWSVDGGGADCDRPTLYPVSLEAAVGAAADGIWNISNPFVLQKMWFCSPCESTKRIDFNILVTTPSNNTVNVPVAIKCVRFRFHTARSGVILANNTWSRDRDHQCALFPHKVALGFPYTTVVSHEIHGMVLTDTASTSADGNLLLVSLRSPPNNVYSGVSFLDTNIEAYTHGIEYTTFPVECYPSRIGDTQAFDGVLKSAALSPLGDRVAVEVLPTHGDWPVIRVFHSKMSIEAIRKSTDEQLGHMLFDDGFGLWQLTTSVRLVIHTTTQSPTTMTPDTMTPDTGLEEENHHLFQRVTTFSPCGRFVLLVSQSVNSTCTRSGKLMHIIDTDLSRGESAGMRQYVTTTAACCMPRDVHWTRAGIWFRTNRGVLLFEPALVADGLKPL
jgi:hypothetical protein